MPPRRLAPGVVVLACACQPAPPHASLITVPQILGARMTVVEEGRHSVDLLPIPADRQRQQPLPEDTVEVELLVVDEDGEIDPATLDVRWFWCQPEMPCVRGQSWPERPACPDDRIPSEPCRLGSASRLRTTIPSLNPSNPVFAQYRMRWLVVAGLPGVRTTDACLDGMTQLRPEDLDGCLIGLSVFELGPLGAFVSAAERDGLELGAEIPPFVEAARQPGFNPELGELVFTDEVRETLAIARRGETTRVPPQAQLFPGSPDSRDAQAYPFVRVIPNGLVTDIVPVGELLTLELLKTSPEHTVGFYSRAIQTGEAGTSMTVLAVLRDGRGGLAWEWLDFEVVP